MGTFEDLREEEEESENETPRDEESGDGTTVAQNENNTQSEQVEAEQMIEQLCDGIWPCDDGTETMSDAELNKLSYLDFEGLRKARAKLAVLSKDKKLDVVFHACIIALVGTVTTRVVVVSVFVQGLTFLVLLLLVFLSRKGVS